MNFDLSLEWLETNGIGGYACGTAMGANTRRYHALLCAATAPPLGRMVLVTKADESLTIAGRRVELGCNVYPGTVHPSGYYYLESFTATPLPRWIYRVPGFDGEADVVVEKTIWMTPGANRTDIRYTLLSGTDAEIDLAVHPFVTGRDYHHLHHANDDFNARIERGPNAGGSLISLRPYSGGPAVEFHCDGAFQAGGAWYYDFTYNVEQERGLDCLEDAWSPGAFVWRLKPGQSAHFAIAADTADKAGATRDEAVARKEKLGEVFAELPDSKRPAAQRLAVAADQLIVRRDGDLRTILAGYPWFSDWGRDTMIALPGLCLTTQRFTDAAAILKAFARACDGGMIPNRFPDHGETPDYNTVDATLWFFHAVAQFLERSGDWETIEKEIYPVLRSCIEFHIAGTRYGIKADPEDGLLSAGSGATQLTWMDAKVGDWVVTPRAGKAVEIQALWFNALRSMMDIADRAGDQPMKDLCCEWSRKAKANFNALFWNAEDNCLYDYVDGDTRDGAIRPNQIFAVSLPHRLLPLDLEKRVIACVQQELLTPHGLRSLSPKDSNYRGIYIGDQWNRDGSYHQGTVWGWLMGPFLTAYLKVNHHTPAAKQQAAAWLQPMIDHLDQACLGSISEIFDGDTPHTPRGCFAQAWSVAEVLRVLVEEL